jgi:putative membrane protein
MIDYDSRNWFRVVFSIRGTVLPAVLKRQWWIVLLATAVYAADVYIPEADPLFKPFKPIGHSLLGLALGLLIVFHNNCAYDRYWEGRKLWGAIVNTSRNLVRGAAAFASDARELANLTAAYSLAVKQLLRRKTDLTEIKPLIPSGVYEQAVAASNPPSMLALHMSRWLAERQRNGRLDSVTAQSLEQMVRSLLDSQGGCERIVKTPIPFAYAVHIRQMLTIYLITLPFALVGEMGWAAIPTVAVVAFGMIGIEEAGNEIEDPFSHDPNDLPLEAICATIAADVRELAEITD